MPEERVATRHQIYDWAATEEILVIGQQFPPFPSLGTVVKLNRGWRWQPVEPAPMPAAVAKVSVSGAELDGQRALLVIYDRFQEREYAIPRTILEDAGVLVTVASSSLKPLTGTGGGKVHPDLLLADVIGTNYEAIVFVGGQGYETNDPEAQRLAREAFAGKKVVAAICIAPITLAKAGVLEGKRVTGALKPVHLENAGAIFTGALVESDGQVITASGPAGSREFGEAIAAAMRQ
jgi:protease I